MNSGKRIDTISGLPETIIHHIMSFLPAKDVARTTTLSKHFKNLWSSFPIIIFDQFFSEKKIGSRKFLDYVKRSIQLRRISPYLQRFRLKLILKGVYLDPRINEIIGFALENNVQELDLKLIKSAYHKLSEGFSLRSLTYLKLNGFQFDIDWLISVCPLLKSLILSRCLIFDNKTINNNAVSHRGSPLTTLSFKGLCITNKWIEERVPMFLNLEILVVKRCNKLRTVKFMNENLKRLNIVDSSVRGIEIVAPNLRFLYISGNAYVTSNWLRAKVSSFRYLQDLKLHKCSKLGTIEIFNDELRCLEILDCEKVVKVVVDAKKLKSFAYRGDVITFRLMNSPRLCNSTLELKQGSQIVEIPQWNLLRNLLSFFSYCETLTLVCHSSKDFIIPEDIRARRLPPLCDVKHLKIIAQNSTIIDTELVDNLLWLSPHLESLCLVNSSTEKIIKFHDEEEEKEIGEDFWCRGLPLKCDSERTSVYCDNQVARYLQVI